MATNLIPASQESLPDAPLDVAGLALLFAAPGRKCFFKVLGIGGAAEAGGPIPSSSGWWVLGSIRCGLRGHISVFHFNL